ncbi:hypothetical protein FSP39_002226 [Pinctada imbricata]|uniref:HPS5-like beta-propeller domain-containing protein n=1 Tax=Pinctada imbricata TaxID=66713 RepID=A0AA88YH38_PINIB|nr:hypothetical protein FSP39_002226 [Pinctada imbricata]
MTPESTNGGPDESPYPGDYLIVESGSLDDLKGPLRRSARLREPSPVNVVAICPANKSVAFSTTNGYVNVMEMNIERRQKPDKLRIVTDHLHTTVTCLQWDGTGDKLFSADLLGKVVVSVIPVSKVKNLVLIPVEIIMKLDSAVVQLDWFSDRLLVSTTNKVCLCNTIKEGAYGSMFYINPSATVPLIYSARPGSRLWEVDFDGNVLNTHQFKQMLAAPPMTVVRIGNDLCTWTEPSKDPFPPQGINFPQLKMIGEQFVLSWRKSCLFIMDPANDVPSLILWVELDKDIHNISCVGTDIYIFYVNSEVQRLQFLTVTQCVSLLTKRKQWAIAAKICCYFETSILQMHHRAYLSTRSLSNLWEKMSMSENGKVMDALSRILFKYESEPRSESEEDRSSDNSVRSRSSSGASIKRLESGIYQIMAAKQGSNTNLQSLGADLKVSVESVIEKDTLLAIDTEKNGVKHVDSVPNGDASLLEVCNTKNGHTEEVASENFKDVSLSDDQDVLEYSSPICGSQGEDDKVGEIGNSSQVLVQFVVGQEPYNYSQSSHPNISEPIETMQTEEQEIVPEKGDLVSFSFNALETEGDKTDEHTRKELLSEETQPIAEKDLSQEMTQDDIDMNTVKIGMEPSVERSLDEKPKIEINPKINAVDIFAEDADVGIVSKKSPKKKKKGKSASTGSKEKKSISAVVDFDDKSQVEFTQIDHNNESSEMSKLSSDPSDPSQTLECTHGVNEENVTSGIITNDISELNEKTREFTSERSSVLNESTEEYIPDKPQENSSVLNESKGIPTQDESTEDEELLTARQFSVSIEDLITSFENGSTEMASISDYEDNDTTVKAQGTDGLSTEKDTKETAGNL